LDNSVPDSVEEETVSNPNPKNSQNPAGLDTKVEPLSILEHQTHSSDSLLLERRPYQTHQKRT